VRRCGEKRAEGSRPAALAGLTERESAIAALVAKRLSNREIAEKLFLSEGSVKQYMKQIYSKLGIQGDTRTKRKQLSELMQQNF
jgi:DNA-binding NarL/FixJ family response regulator